MTPDEIRDAMQLAAEVYSDLTPATLERLKEPNGHAGATDTIAEYVYAAVTAAIKHYGSLDRFWLAMAEDQRGYMPLYDVAGTIAEEIKHERTPEQSAAAVLAMIEEASR